MQETAPNGFTFADRIQQATFEVTGIVFGAAKVTHIDGRLAVRLHPPKNDRYVRAYQDGWRSARDPEERTRVVRLGTDAERAFWDGYRDHAEGRMKWHLAHCRDHGDHETGCHA